MSDQKEPEPFEGGPIGEIRENSHPDGWFPDDVQDRMHDIGGYGEFIPDLHKQPTGTTGELPPDTRQASEDESA